MRLEGRDDDILRAEIGGILACRQDHGALRAGAAQRQPARLDRREMGAARDDRDGVAGPRQLDREIAADRPGSEDRSSAPSSLVSCVLGLAGMIAELARGSLDLIEMFSLCSLFDNVDNRPRK
jgi:hypothetical protein